MEFSKGSLMPINADGQQIGAITPMIGKNIKISSDILSDVIVQDNDVSCEIFLDAFGKFFIKNYCKNPVMVNNNQLIKKRLLTNNSIIQIGNTIFKWTAVTSNNAASDPTKRTKSASTKLHRKTTHIRVALFSSSNDDNQTEDKLNRSLPSHNQSQIITQRNKENNELSSSLKLNLSGIVQTSYSPSASKRIGSQKKTNNVTPFGTPKTPISAYKTPNTIQTPMDSCSKIDSAPFRLNNSRVYSFVENSLIDLTTTPDKFQTPKSVLLKSAIKNSAAKRQENVSLCSSSDAEFTTPSTTKKRIVNSRIASSSSAKVIAFNTTFRSTPKSVPIKRIIKTPTTVVRASKVVTPQTQESLLHSLGVQELAVTPKSLIEINLTGNNTLNSSKVAVEDSKRRTKGELGTYSRLQLKTDGSVVSSPIAVNSESLQNDDEIVLDDDNVFVETDKRRTIDVLESQLPLETSGILESANECLSSENDVVLRNDKRRTKGELGTYSRLQLKTDGSVVSSPIAVNSAALQIDDEIVLDDDNVFDETNKRRTKGELGTHSRLQLKTDGSVVSADENSSIAVNLASLQTDDEIVVENDDVFDETIKRKTIGVLESQLPLETDESLASINDVIVLNDSNKEKNMNLNEIIDEMGTTSSRQQLKTDESMKSATESLSSEVDIVLLNDTKETSTNVDCDDMPVISANDTEIDEIPADGGCNNSMISIDSSLQENDNVFVDEASEFVRKSFCEVGKYVKLATKSSLESIGSVSSDIPVSTASEIDTNDEESNENTSETEESIDEDLDDDTVQTTYTIRLSRRSTIHSILPDGSEEFNDNNDGRLENNSFTKISSTITTDEIKLSDDETTANLSDNDAEIKSCLKMDTDSEEKSDDDDDFEIESDENLEQMNDDELNEEIANEKACKNNSTVSIIEGKKLQIEGDANMEINEVELKNQDEGEITGVQFQLDSNEFAENTNEPETGGDHIENDNNELETESTAKDEACEVMALSESIESIISESDHQTSEAKSTNDEWTTIDESLTDNVILNKLNETQSESNEIETELVQTSQDDPIGTSPKEISQNNLISENVEQKTNATKGSLIKSQSSPLNELSDLRGVKELLKTPHTSNITDVRGVKNLFHKSPVNDLTNVVGVKELLLNTPTNNKSGLNNLQGVKHLFKTPIVNAGITDVRGVQEIMKTPHPRKLLLIDENDDKCPDTHIAESKNQDQHKTVEDSFLDLNEFLQNSDENEVDDESLIDRQSLSQSIIIKEEEESEIPINITSNSENIFEDLETESRTNDESNDIFVASECIDKSTINSNDEVENAPLTDVQSLSESININENVETTFNVNIISENIVKAESESTEQETIIGDIENNDNELETDPITNDVANEGVDDNIQSTINNLSCADDAIDNDIVGAESESTEQQSTIDDIENNDNELETDPITNDVSNEVPASSESADVMNHSIMNNLSCADDAVDNESLTDEKSLSESIIIKDDNTETSSIATTVPKNIIEAESEIGDIENNDNELETDPIPNNVSNEVSASSECVDVINQSAMNNLSCADDAVDNKSLTDEKSQSESIIIEDKKIEPLSSITTTVPKNIIEAESEIDHIENNDNKLETDPITNDVSNEDSASSECADDAIDDESLTDEKSLSESIVIEDKNTEPSSSIATTVPENSIESEPEIGHIENNDNELETAPITNDVSNDVPASSECLQSIDKSIANSLPITNDEEESESLTDEKSLSESIIIKDKDESFESKANLSINDDLDSIVDESLTEDLETNETHKLEQNEENDSLILIETKQTTQNESISYSPNENDILMKTQSSPLNELSDLRGVKELMKTPYTTNLCDLRGVKEMLKTPYTSNISNVEGVKKLFDKSPVNDLTNVVGVKELLLKSPTNNSGLKDLQGVKNLFKTPIVNNGITDVRGVKELMKTPFEAKNILDNFDGVQDLLKTPHPRKLLPQIDEVEDLGKTSVKDTAESTVEDTQNLQPAQKINVIEEPSTFSVSIEIHESGAPSTTLNLHEHQLLDIAAEKFSEITPAKRGRGRKASQIESEEQSSAIASAKRGTRKDTNKHITINNATEPAALEKPVESDSNDEIINETTVEESHKITSADTEIKIETIQTDLTKNHELLDVADEKSSEITLPKRGRRKASQIESVDTPTKEHLPRVKRQKAVNFIDEQPSQITAAKRGTRKAVNKGIVEKVASDPVVSESTAESDEIIEEITVEQSPVHPETKIDSIQTESVNPISDTKNQSEITPAKRGRGRKPSASKIDTKDLQLLDTAAEKSFETTQAKRGRGRKPSASNNDTEGHQLLVHTVEKSSEIKPAKRGRGRKPSVPKIDSVQMPEIIATKEPSSRGKRQKNTDVAVEQESKVVTPAKRGRRNANNEQTDAKVVSVIEPAVESSTNGDDDKDDSKQVNVAFEKPITLPKRSRRKANATEIEIVAKNQDEIVVETALTHEEDSKHNMANVAVEQQAKRGRRNAKAATNIDQIDNVQKISDLEPEPSSNHDDVKNEPEESNKNIEQPIKRITPAKRGRRKANATEVDTVATNENESESNTEKMANKHKLLDVAAEQQSEVTPAKRGRRKANTAAEIGTVEKIESASKIDENVKKTSQIKPVRRGRRKASAADNDVFENVSTAAEIETASEVFETAPKIDENVKQPSQIQPVRRGRRKASAADIDVIENNETDSKQSQKHKLPDVAVDQASQITPAKRGRRKANPVEIQTVVSDSASNTEKDSKETNNLPDDAVEQQSSQNKPTKRGGRRNANTVDVEAIETDNVENPIASSAPIDALKEIKTRGKRGKKQEPTIVTVEQQPSSKATQVRKGRRNAKETIETITEPIEADVNVGETVTVAKPRATRGKKAKTEDAAVEVVMPEKNSKTTAKNKKVNFTVENKDNEIIEAAPRLRSRRM